MYPQHMFLGRSKELLTEEILGNRRIRPFISGEQKSKTEGNRGTKAILGNRENRKLRF